MTIELNETEKEYRAELNELFEQLRSAIANRTLGSDPTDLIERLGTKAHELHMLLKSRGFEPKHHKYMVENRGLPADHPEFYKHYHPVEDLLAFLYDEHANDDPEDQTIGASFNFDVYSNRWGHNDRYHIKRTATGWEIKHLMIGGPSDKRGDPGLFANFTQDSIAYPNKIGDCMEELWDIAEEKGLSREQVQEALQQLADWVSTTEKSRPSFSF